VHQRYTQHRFANRLGEDFTIMGKLFGFNARNNFGTRLAVGTLAAGALLAVAPASLALADDAPAPNIGSALTNVGQFAGTVGTNLNQFAGTAGTNLNQFAGTAGTNLNQFAGTGGTNAGQFGGTAGTNAGQFVGTAGTNAGQVLGTAGTNTQRLVGTAWGNLIRVVVGGQSNGGCSSTGGASCR
jgi:hypothetical protein